MKILLNFIFLLLCTAGISQKMSIVSLPAIADGTISNSEYSYNNQALLIGADSLDRVHRGLVKFDFSELPIGELKNATLTLTGTNEGANIISMYRLYQDWEGVSVTSTEKSMSWERTSSSGPAWMTPGGNFEEFPSARAFVSGNRTNDITGPAMIRDVSNWMQNDSSNYGWILIGQEQSSNSALSFYSSLNIAQGPILTLIIESPDSCFAYAGEASTLGGQDEVALCEDDLTAINCVVNNKQGESHIWLVTDLEGDILGFSRYASVEISEYPNQQLLIHHLSFNGGILGADVGSNIRNLSGCYDLSNTIKVLGDRIDGGVIYTQTKDDDITVCPYDLSVINGIELENNVGTYTSWIVSNQQGIIEIWSTSSLTELENLPAGDYQIRSCSYQGRLTGAIVGNRYQDITGCYDMSNVINVSLQQLEDCKPECEIEASFIKGNSITLCDGLSVGQHFTSDSLVLSEKHGTYAIWLITNRRGDILVAAPNPALLRFNVVEEETVYLFHLSYNDFNFTVTNNIYEFQGCYGISEAFPIIGQEKNNCKPECELENPVITFSDDTDTITICDLDDVNNRQINSTADILTESTYILSDEEGIIYAINTDPLATFEAEEALFSQVTQIVFNNEIDSIIIGDSLGSITGCYALSNSLLLNRNNCPEKCEMPTNFQIVENISGTVTITWDKNDNAERYEFQIAFDVDTSNYTTIPVNRNWIQFSNPSRRPLSFRVRANCSDNTNSEYSELQQFITTFIKEDISNSRSLQTSNVQGYTLAPNPASKQIRFSYPEIEVNASLTIMNSAGQVVSQVEIPAKSSDVIIDIQDLNPGIHILILRSGDQLYTTQRFIKIQ